MSDVRTWKFAVTTPQGIYYGDLIGQMEPNETYEHAMQGVADTVKAWLQDAGQLVILACFVSDKALHIDAPGTTFMELDLQKDFAPPVDKDKYEQEAREEEG